jgi:hypothetical protein
METTSLDVAQAALRSPIEAEAECSHVVQIYDDEQVLLDALECFVVSGLHAGESVVLFSTPAHLHELEKRLHASSLQLDRARWEGRYVALLAEETLARFMVDGQPDEHRFNAVVASLLERALADGRRARAFGEMMSFLMSRGQAVAATRLEELWNATCRRHGLLVFCAYPRACFSLAPTGAMEAVRDRHHLVVEGRVPALPTALDVESRLIAHFSGSDRVKVDCATSRFTWPRQDRSAAETAAVDFLRDEQAAKLIAALASLVSTLPPAYFPEPLDAEARPACSSYFDALTASLNAAFAQASAQKPVLH